MSQSSEEAIVYRPTYSLYNLDLKNLLEVNYCAIGVHFTPKGLVNSKNKIKQLINNDTILYFFTDLFLCVL